MGSSSTYGTGATSPSHTYPAVLQHDLAAALPGATIRVINRGVPGEDLFEMLPRLDRDVIAEHPDLVILQLGTNFVLKRLPIDKFLPALTVAINRVQQSGADIVLMDPQYAPRLAGWSEVDSVVREMNEVSERGHIDLISRYAMMKTWAKRGQFASGSMLSHDGLHMNDASYSCLGDTVASAVLDALQPAATAQMVSTEHPRGSAHSVKTPRLPAQHIIR